MRFLLLNITLLLLLSNWANGQASFWINGQIRPRAEFRNGYKTLQNDSSSAIAYVEQRSRLGIGYKNDFLEIYLQAQDVRTWGSTSFVNNSNGFFTLFNAWAKMHATPNISIKVGRQVFSYDNQRILGGLNWAAQGSAHDAILFQYKNDSNQIALQVGGAYNALQPSLNAQPYTVTRNYKTMQFIRFHKEIKYFDFSLLVLNVGQEGMDQKLYFELTGGGIFKLKIKSFQATLEGYYQYGRTNANLIKNAYLLAAKFDLNLKQFKFGLGADFLSGTNYDKQGMQNNSFSPWLGSNHGFYGLIDYFYVGSSHQDAGLLDAYAKATFQPTTNMNIGLAYHFFYAPSLFYDNRQNQEIAGGHLAHEIDMVFNYKIKKYISLKLGYSHLFGVDALEALKPSGTIKTINNWAWLMLDVNLELFRHTIKSKRNVDPSKRRF